MYRKKADIWIYRNCCTAPTQCRHTQVAFKVGMLLVVSELLGCSLKD